MQDEVEPFKLDSSKAKAELQAFLDRHNNLSQLSREAADVAPGLTDSTRASLTRYVGESWKRRGFVSLLVDMARTRAVNLTHSNSRVCPCHCSKHAQLHDKAVQEYASLMKGLSGDPILILYGSDGGNAQSVAKKLAGEAKQRGLAPRYGFVGWEECGG